MRRKQRPESLNFKPYPYRAAFSVVLRPARGYKDAERAAAAAISGGDFRSWAPTRSRYSIEYLFKRPEQAHAMQVWFEAHADPYDDWQEWQRSYEATRREERWRSEITEGLAVTGTWDRIRRARGIGGREAARELLRELEPWVVDVNVADRVLSLMPPSGP